MNFGKKIQELRKAKNLTQDELAADLGVTATAVSKWENGYTLPDILMLCAVADYFEVTADELLGRNLPVKYAIIAAETEKLGEKVAGIAKGYGIKSRGIYTVYSDAVAAAAKDDAVEYLISCFFSGYYGEESSVCNLVSVAPTEEEILVGIENVFRKYLKD